MFQLNCKNILNDKHIKKQNKKIYGYKYSKILELIRKCVLSFSFNKIYHFLILALIIDIKRGAPVNDKQAIVWRILTSRAQFFHRALCIVQYA